MIADTWLGALACAEGSQTWSGKNPALSPKPTSASQNSGARSRALAHRPEVPAPGARSEQREEREQSAACPTCEATRYSQPPADFPLPAFQRDQEVAGDREHLPGDQEMQPVRRRSARHPCSAAARSTTRDRASPTPGIGVRPVIARVRCAHRRPPRHQEDEEEGARRRSSRRCSGSPPTGRPERHFPVARRSTASNAPASAAAAPSPTKPATAATAGIPRPRPAHERTRRSRQQQAPTSRGRPPTGGPRRGGVDRRDRLENPRVRRARPDQVAHRSTGQLPAQSRQQVEMRAWRRRDEVPAVPVTGTSSTRLGRAEARSRKRSAPPRPAFAAQRDAGARVRQREAAADRRHRHAAGRAQALDEQPFTAGVTPGSADATRSNTCARSPARRRARSRRRAAEARAGHRSRTPTAPARGTRPARQARASPPTAPPGRGRTARVRGRAVCGSPSSRIQPSITPSATPNDSAICMRFRYIVLAPREGASRRSSVR